MEKSAVFTKDANKVTDRHQITESLITKISISEEEKEFLDLSTQNRDTWAITASTLYSAKLIESALSQHASALKEAAKSSDRHAKSLSFATWVLAFATTILAIATIALLYKH